MDDLTRNLEELGRAVATDLDAHDEKVGDLAAVRERLLGADVRPPSRRRVAVVASLAAAAALAALALVFVRAERTPPITFTTDAAHQQQAGVVGEWIAATPDERVALSFSEGTRFVLAPGARARVTSAAVHGAALTLEEGRLDATVTHHDARTAWSLRAGPFDVQITGTRFTADWDPGRVVFELEMQEGTVVVTGPELDGGRRLSAGERLRVSVREHASTEERIRPPSAVAANDVKPAPAASTDAPPGDVEPSPSPSLSPSLSPSQSPSPSESPGLDDGAGYAALVGSGHADQALARADRAGFAAVIARAPLADVTALADAARLRGRPAEARAR
jgi:hypothetical protein